MSKPAPYAADVRAKGWRFEVDYEKVKASDTWLRAKKGDIRGALLLLWAESWQQTPCGSLPNDDELIALLIDMSPLTFTKHRSVLMRGWTLADDGRYYHETITARVLDMLAKRVKDAKRSADRRARSMDSGQNPPGVTGASRVTPVGVGPEFDTKHQAPSTSNSEPNGSGGKPPLTSDEIIFGYGVPLLVNAGNADKAARSFLGGLRKGHGDEAVVNALRNCLREKPLQPLEWLAAALPPAGAKAKPNAQEALEASNRAVGERFLAEQEAARATH